MRNSKFGIQMLCAAVLFGALALTARAAQAPAEIKLGATCITAECHGTLNKAQFVHGPMNMGQCEPCHVPVNGRHEFRKNTDLKGLCLTCHTVEPPKKDVHRPFATDCTLCHNPHSSDNRYFVKGGTGAQGCYKCHDQITKGMSFTHGPVGQGECLACHTPHQSDQPKLLTDAPTKLCLNCHTDFSAELEGAVSIHPPAQKDCTGCHAPHGGATKAFLPAEGKKLCEKCHGDFLKGMDKLKFPHQPMVEGKACENCHQPHASKQEKLLKGKNEELCLSCHNKPIQAKTRQIPNVEEQLKGSKYLHGPLREGNCIACHAAHGSNFANILDKAFPAGFYEPYKDKAYDLCFACHDKKIVQSERSTDTGFRNGDKNLHFLHVNREKGRSCRACHDEHASNQPKHIRESVLFGNYTMHAQYTKTDTGGGCATGCHQPYKYDRKDPVDNKVPGGSKKS